MIKSNVNLYYYSHILDHASFCTRLFIQKGAVINHKMVPKIIKFLLGPSSITPRKTKNEGNSVKMSPMSEISFKIVFIDSQSFPLSSNAELIYWKLNKAEKQ